MVDVTNTQEMTDAVAAINTTYNQILRILNDSDKTDITVLREVENFLNRPFPATEGFKQLKNVVNFMSSLNRNKFTAFLFESRHACLLLLLNEKAILIALHLTKTHKITIIDGVYRIGLADAIPDDTGIKYPYRPAFQPSRYNSRENDQHGQQRYSSYHAGQQQRYGSHHAGQQQRYNSHGKHRDSSQLNTHAKKPVMFMGDMVKMLDQITTAVEAADPKENMENSYLKKLLGVKPSTEIPVTETVTEPVTEMPVTEPKSKLKQFASLTGWGDREDS
jgi:hypothetical protein